MPAPPSRDDETADALEHLLEGPTPKTALPPRSAAPRRPPTVAFDCPYRCLDCGYPLAGAAGLRCPECGRAYDGDTLDLWFDGTERSRFDHVLWLVSASLLLRLLVLPDLLFVSRLGVAVVTVWACRVASRGKEDSLGGYYGFAGMIAALVMLFVFAWFTTPLAFHTLDIMTAGLLVQAMLHGPADQRLGLAAGGRWLALALLVIAPLFALACHVLDEGWGNTMVPLTPALDPYPPFRFVIPYVAAAIAWAAAWLTLAGLRRSLFPTPRTD